MASASEAEPVSVELEAYLKALEALKIANKRVPPKDMMTIRWVEIMRQRIHSALLVIESEGDGGLHKTIKDTLKTYDVDHREGRHVLIMKPVPGTDAPGKIIVPLEKTYDIVHKAHVATNHGSVEEMEDWLNGTQYLINKLCIPAYFKLCSACNERNVPLPSPPEGEITPVFESTLLSTADFEYVVSLDILNLTHNPDVCYKYLLVYQDQRNCFVQLRPLNTITEAEITIEVIKIFMDFGPPRCILVEPKNEVLFRRTLDEIKKLSTKSLKMALHPTTEQPKLLKTVEKKLKSWMKEQECRNWGTGCHIVQWIMNNRKNEDGASPISKIFGYKTKSQSQRPHDQPVSDSSDEEETDAEHTNTNTDVDTTDDPLGVKIEFDSNVEVDLNTEDDEMILGGSPTSLRQHQDQSNSDEDENTK